MDSNNNNQYNNSPLFKGEGLGERLYEDALAELAVIARKMEDGDYDIDQLAEQLKRAQVLIKLCRDKLTKTDEEIKKILAEGE